MSATLPEQARAKREPHWCEDKPLLVEITLWWLGDDDNYPKWDIRDSFDLIRGDMLLSLVGV